MMFNDVLEPLEMLPIRFAFEFFIVWAFLTSSFFTPRIAFPLFQVEIDKVSWAQF